MYFSLLCFSRSRVSVSVPYLAGSSPDDGQESQQYDLGVLESDFLISISEFVCIRK